MPLREKYKWTWSSSSGAAKSNRIPSLAFKYDNDKKAWRQMRGTTGGGDFYADVTDAESIYGHIDRSNSASGTSTDVTVHIHASWGTTGDGTRNDSGYSWTSSGNPYTSKQVSTTASSTAVSNNAQAGFLITSGPDLLRPRADSSSSGGHSTSGTQLILNVSFKS